MKIEKAIDIIESVIDLEGSEIGESWSMLVDLQRYLYCFNDEFGKQVEAEIISQAKMIQERCTVVTKKETIEHELKTLEWDL